MPSFHFRRAAVLVPALVLAASGLKAAEDAKSTAVAFAGAIVSGDKKAVHDLSFGTPEQFKMIDLLTESLSAIPKLVAACDNKYGADNPFTKSFGALPNMKTVAARADYVVQGDVATAVDKAKPDEINPLRLKLKEGKWKVDLAIVGDENVQINPMMKYCGELADEINAGKYPTVLDAVTAMQKKIDALKPAAQSPPDGAKVQR